MRIAGFHHAAGHSQLIFVRSAETCPALAKRQDLKVVMVVIVVSIRNKMTYSFGIPVNQAVEWVWTGLIQPFTCHQIGSDPVPSFDKL